MLISTKHKFVFFCMEKCASNSIEEMLGPYCDIHLRGAPEIRHTDVKAFEHHILPYLTESGVPQLERICLVREPISWLSSWYRFRSRHELRDPAHPHHDNCTHGLSFDDFVAGYLSDHQKPFADVGRQTDFVLTENQHVGIDRLFAYESMGDFLRYVGDKIGVELKLGYRNISPGKMQSSDLSARFSSLNRRLMRKLNIRHGAKHVRKEDSTVSISPDLEARLRHRIAQDFDLHARALKAGGR